MIKQVVEHLICLGSSPTSHTCHLVDSVCSRHMRERV